ncbi:hybrid sensor histidine kinase/response regulator [Coprobacter sp.]
MEDQKIVPSSYSILIVDDVLANVMLLQAILKKEGFRIRTASSGIDALKSIDEERPDLLLLDIMMPEMDGYETIMHIRSNPEIASIPVIFLTALDNSESIVKGFKLGANDYLSKPFKREELMIRVYYQLDLLDARRTILRQQEELQQIIVGRDKIYSVISHDLRSPIGSIKMMSNVMLSLIESGNDMSEFKDLLQMINKTSEEVYSLLDNLLKWTKNQLGSLKLSRQDIDIRAIVSDIRDIYTPIAVQKGISLIMPDPVVPEIVSVDVEMVKTIIRNLISNAIKFTFEGGSITVNTGVQGKGLQITVKDTGQGIAPENQYKLLNSKSHFTTFGTNKEKGSGLGLLLCKDFAELHGGKLWFTSELGKGTTFYATIPCIRE